MRRVNVFGDLICDGLSRQMSVVCNTESGDGHSDGDKLDICLFTQVDAIVAVDTVDAADDAVRVASYDGVLIEDQRAFKPHQPRSRRFVHGKVVVEATATGATVMVAYSDGETVVYTGKWVGTRPAVYVDGVALAPV